MTRRRENSKIEEEGIWGKIVDEEGNINIMEEGINKLRRENKIVDEEENEKGERLVKHCA